MVDQVRLGDRLHQGRYSLGLPGVNEALEGRSVHTGTGASRPGREFTLFDPLENRLVGYVCVVGRFGDRPDFEGFIILPNPAGSAFVDSLLMVGRHGYILVAKISRVGYDYIVLLLPLFAVWLMLRCLYNTRLFS